VVAEQIGAVYIAALLEHCVELERDWQEEAVDFGLLQDFLLCR
jgi:hypothetical protein